MKSCMHPDHSLSPATRAASASLPAEEMQRSLPVIVKLLEVAESSTTPLSAERTHGAAPRLIGDLNDVRAMDALRGWLRSRLGAVDLSSLLPLENRPRLAKSFEQSQVLILRRPSRATANVIGGILSSMVEPPEIILVDAPHPVPEELREAGIGVAFHLPGESPIELVGQAILDTFRIHIPLKESCLRAVGKVPLREALALVRLYMVREAFDRTGSKRGAARVLGVTRPAVQQMLHGQTHKGAT